jgi:hypothetical protein
MQNKSQFTEKELKAWKQAVKKFNEAETPEEEIEAFKGLLKAGKKLGIPEEAIFVRVLQVAGGKNE